MMNKIQNIIDKISDENAEHDPNISKVVLSKLNKILEKLIKDCSDIAGCIICQVDGMALAGQLAPDLDEHRFSAMSSALLALSDNVVKEMHGGKPRSVLIESDEGNVLIMHAGEKLLLMVTAKAKANIGLSLAHAKKTAEEIALFKIQIR